MPDITMCKGEHCPKKEDCYRYTATPTLHRQSYFVEIPCEGKYFTQCEYFWSNKGE